MEIAVDDFWKTRKWSNYLSWQKTWCEKHYWTFPNIESKNSKYAIWNACDKSHIKFCKSSFLKHIKSTLHINDGWDETSGKC